MNNPISRWWRRRKVVRRLIAYAKTPEGYECILKMNQMNQILADLDNYDLGGSVANLGKPWRIKLPNEEWRKLQ